MRAGADVTPALPDSPNSFFPEAVRLLNTLQPPTHPSIPVYLLCSVLFIVLNVYYPVYLTYITALISHCYVFAHYAVLCNMLLHCNAFLKKRRLISMYTSYIED